MAKTDKTLEAKKARLVSKIKELAPSIDMLVNMMDETRIDLALIAFRGEQLDRSSDDA